MTDASHLAPGLGQIHVGDFGRPFHWGVSTAAYQIEGGWCADGKGPSVWDDFSARKRKAWRGQDGRVACDHYNRFAHDLDLMARMGIPNYRFSVSWSRVLPEGTGRVNMPGLDYYDRLVDACLERGITPWVTLYHWDLPLALERRGGWTNRQILDWLTEYAQIVARRLGDRVRYWMVLNEPMVFTGAGYFLGLHAPGRRGMKHFLPALHHATLAMGEGARALRAHLPGSARVGTTFSSSWVEAAGPERRHQEAAMRVDAALNRMFIEPILGLGYPTRALPLLSRIEPYMAPGDEARLACDFDFLGLQLYTREIVAHSWLTPYAWARLVPPKQRGVPYTLMNWEIYPEALYRMLDRWRAYPRMPAILITENGAAFHDTPIGGRVHDPLRQAYLESHIAQVRRAQAEGAPIEGYFVWTFTDNFEWAERYRPRFGLVYCDFDTQERIIKDSGHWYGQFIAGERTLAAPVPYL